jgi:hypothetical protein
MWKKKFKEQGREGIKRSKPVARKHPRQSKPSVIKKVLKSQYNLSERSIVIHLIDLRAICNKVIRDGVMNKNKYPFGGDGIIIRIPSSIKWD